jgi:hypothetical protein
MILRLDKFQGGIIPFYNSLYNVNYKYNPLNNDKILEVINPELLTNTGSAINNYDCLANFMVNLDPSPIDIIEIGTFMGLGSALLASYSRTVFTFDICYRNSHHIWNELEIDDRINCFCGDQEFIDEIIRDLKYNPKYNFNFAFIDGMHKMENVKHDFSLVKFCGRVLFHDCNIEEIRQFVIDELGSKIINSETDEPAKFGYWEIN